MEFRRKIGLMDHLLRASAFGIADAIRMKKVSSEEVVEACLRRIERVNAKINAVVQLAPEDALAAARLADSNLAARRILGALHGVPMTIKDSIDTKGIITTCGTKGRAKNVPRHDATIVSRLRHAGAIILGKTNVPELCLTFHSANLVYGRTYNPWDATRSPGGSSGGSAAIVSAWGSPLDIGSDLGGSVRVPSHFCGVCGIKPTSGRVPKTGNFPEPGDLLDSLWQFGPISRYVEDLRLTLPIISGPDGLDPSVVPVPFYDAKEIRLKTLRVRFYLDDGIKTPRFEIKESVVRAAKAFEEIGASVEECRPTLISETDTMMSELWRLYAPSVQKAITSAKTRHLHAATKADLKSFRQKRLTLDDIHTLMHRLSCFRRKMLRFFECCDVILCPPNAEVALPWKEFEEDMDAFVRHFRYTQTFNLAGWPAAVVPISKSSDNLPIGVQIVSHPWREDIVLAVARHLEHVFGGWKPPPI